MKSFFIDLYIFELLYIKEISNLKLYKTGVASSRSYVDLVLHDKITYDVNINVKLFSRVKICIHSLLLMYTLIEDCALIQIYTQKLLTSAG